MRVVAILWVFLLVTVAFAGSSAAASYSVNSSRFATTATLFSTNLWDTYELLAVSASRVSFSVTTVEPGCVMLFYVKGHDIHLDSEYYTEYSQRECVTSYANDFLVGSVDGAHFTIVILTNLDDDVQYTLNVRIVDQKAPALLAGLLIIIVIGALAGGIGVVWKYKVKAKASLSQEFDAPGALQKPPSGPAPPPPAR